LPSDIIGQVVSIAEKIDTICAVFALNKIPTGSNDPLAVRRAAIGILQITMQKKLNINRTDLIDKTIENFDIEIKDKNKLKSMIIEFIIQRLKGILGAKYEQNYIDAVLSSYMIQFQYYCNLAQKYDQSYMNSVFSSRCPLRDLNDTVSRLDVLNKLKTNSEFEKILTSQNRVYKLLKNFDEKSFNIDKAYFKEDIESKLFDKLNIAKDAKDYDDLIKNYIELSPVLEEFFEKVMVNDKDEKIKNNRLSLLFLTNNIYLKLADFSKI
jgi:glycyl-tRNA synthetase beta chain